MTFIVLVISTNINRITSASIVDMKIWVYYYILIYIWLLAKVRTAFRLAAKKCWAH